MKRAFQLLWALFAGFAALGLYAFWIEPQSIRVVEHEIVLPNGAKLPRDFKIAVIADLHAGAPHIDEAKIERVVALTNATTPDLVLLAGDYVIQQVVGGKHIPIEIIAGQLRGLSAPLGIFAVLGNHDNWEDAAHIGDVLQVAGIEVLENRSKKLKNAAGSFYLFGFSDESTTIPNIITALSDVPEKSPALCFTHSPDIFPDLPPKCSLTITGHTHGGQVWLPFVGRLVVPSRYGQRYAAGLVVKTAKRFSSRRALEPASCRFAFLCRLRYRS